MKQTNDFVYNPNTNSFMASSGKHTPLTDTNQQTKLDEILIIAFNDVLNIGRGDRAIPYSEITNVVNKTKQAIADLFEEECLEEVRDAFREGYFASGIIPNEQNIDAFNIAYIHYFNKFTREQREKAKQVKGER